MDNLNFWRWGRLLERIRRCGFLPGKVTVNFPQNELYRLREKFIAGGKILDDGQECATQLDVTWGNT
ncbi:MAG: hypothetical protein AA908_08030 [Chlorobi bacterium NICIL-2]|nr:MAG: hypothetical protein AA908_08030 [Chlorobi bacterium NICIL-2]